MTKEAYKNRAYGLDNKSLWSKISNRRHWRQCNGSIWIWYIKPKRILPNLLEWSKKGKVMLNDELYGALTGQFKIHGARY
jgi:hypothetical protein